MFTSCDITSYNHTMKEVVTTTAFANPNHHNKQKFSYVSVIGENDDGVQETWYGKVISFLEFSVVVDNVKGKVYTCFK